MSAAAVRGGGAEPAAIEGEGDAQQMRAGKELGERLLPGVPGQFQAVQQRRDFRPHARFAGRTRRLVASISSR